MLQVLVALLALSGAASALKDPVAGRKLLATGLAQAFSSAQAELGNAKAASLAQSAASSSFPAATAAQTFASVATSSPSSAVDTAASAIAQSYASAKAVAATAAHAFILPSVEVQVLATTWEQCLAKAICLAPRNAGVAIAIAFSDALAVDRATCGATCQSSAFAQATARALALAVDSCGCDNPAIAVAQAVAELGPTDAYAFLEALALASSAAGITLPACIFPLPCVYIAPVIVAFTCGVPVRVVFEQCAIQPVVIIICGKAGLPVTPDQATCPAKLFVQEIGDVIKGRIQGAADVADREGARGAPAAPEAEQASQEVAKGADVGAAPGASLKSDVGSRLAQRVRGQPAAPGQTGQQEQPQQESQPEGAPQEQTAQAQPSAGTQSLAEALRQRGQAAKPVPTMPSGTQAAIVPGEQAGQQGGEQASQQSQQSQQGQQGQQGGEQPSQQGQQAQELPQPQSQPMTQSQPQGQTQPQPLTRGQQGQGQQVAQASADECASICAGYWQGVSGASLPQAALDAITAAGCNPGADYCAKPTETSPTTTTTGSGGRPARGGRSGTLPSAGAGSGAGADTGSEGGGGR